MKNSVKNVKKQKELKGGKSAFLNWEESQKKAASNDVYGKYGLAFGFTEADMPTDPVQRAALKKALAEW